MRHQIRGRHNTGENVQIEVMNRLLESVEVWSDTNIGNETGWVWLSSDDECVCMCACVCYMNECTPHTGGMTEYDYLCPS